MNRVRKLLAVLGLALTHVLLFASSAMGQQPPGAAPGTNELDVVEWRYIAAGVAICLAAAVGTLAQSKVAMAGLEGIARNPEAGGRIFNTLVLAMALIESLVIYVLIISFLILP